MSIDNFRASMGRCQSTSRSGFLLIELLFCFLFITFFTLLLAQFQVLIIRWQAESVKWCDGINKAHSILARLDVDPSLKKRSFNEDGYSIKFSFKKPPTPRQCPFKIPQNFSIAQVELVWMGADGTERHFVSASGVRL